MQVFVIYYISIDTLDSILDRKFIPLIINCVFWAILILVSKLLSQYRLTMQDARISLKAHKI